MQIRTSADLASAIHSARIARRLTQDQLAAAAGTGPRFVGELERGKATIRFETLLRVVDALGLQLELGGPGLDDRSR